MKIKVDQATPGMKVWVYPASYRSRKGGPIAEKTIASIEGHWYLTFTDGKKHYPSHRNNLYTTLESAQEQQAQDRAEPPWMNRGRFRVACGRTLENYLSAASGIPRKQIEVRKTEAYIYVCWVRDGCLNREKIRHGVFYNLTEENLNPIVAKMAGAIPHGD